MKNTRLVFILLIAIIIVILPSCSNPSSGKEQNSITVLVEGGSPAEQVITQTQDEFYEKSGYRINVETVPYNGVYDKLRTEVSSQAGAYDVAVVDTIWIPSLAEGLEPINGIISDNMRNELFPGLLDGAKIDNNIYGLPTWTNAKTLMYRKDLFNNNEYQQAFQGEYGYELSPPNNWKEYIDTATFFSKNPVIEEGEDFYGTTVFGAGSGDTVASWLDHVTQAGADDLVINENDEVVVNNQAHVEALNFLKKLTLENKTVPASTLEISATETFQLFQDGKSAMMLNWAQFYIPANGEGSSIEGDVGVAPMIAGDAGRGAVPGPWYQVIPSSSENKDIAKEYLSFMYDKNEQYMEVLGVAAKEPIFEKYADQEGFAHIEPLQKTLSAPQTQNRPTSSKWQQIEAEALIPAVQKVLAGQQTAQKSLDQAKEKIETILEEE